MTKSAELLAKAYDWMKEMHDLVEEDEHRLQYHIMPPVGLLNDPNGFIQINGEYHLFYQLHPFTTGHGLKYWGHVKSRDLVHWEVMPLALIPGEWYETHGCYSGSGVNDQGVFTLIYTGNVKDEKGNRETYQCLATSQDGIFFEKSSNNPVMKNQPLGYTRHFRDPKVWQHGDYWYMVIGAQTVAEEGRVLLFKSSNLQAWQMVGEVTGTNLKGVGDLGYMWECPDLFELNGQDILLACPQGMEPKGDLYNNRYQSGYFVGKLDYETGRMVHGPFVELDRGFEFYAPQTMVCDQGRRIMVGWMGLPDEEDHPTTQYGWIHCLTLPRILELTGDRLIQKPIPELESLRGDMVAHRQILIEDGEIELAGVSGAVFELLAEFKLQTASSFGIKVRTAADGTEETLLYYDQEQEKFILDREQSGAGYGGVRRCHIPKNDRLKIHLYADTSSVEIFLNDGIEVFTARIYPEQKSQGIRFFAQGGSVLLEQISKWDLKGMTE